MGSFRDQRRKVWRLLGSMFLQTRGLGSTRLPQFYTTKDYNNKQSYNTKSLGIQSYCQLMIGVSNHLLSTVFRFHYHSQKVIGFLGNIKFVKNYDFKGFLFARPTERLNCRIMEPEDRSYQLRKNLSWSLTPR